MKKIVVFTILFLCDFYIFAQTGDVCSDALPFCTDIVYDFANNTSGSAPASPNYGCLMDKPAPIWYYMKVVTPGTFKIELSQNDASGNALDIDFAMWGPFTSLSTGCTSIMNGSLAPIQCSFSNSNIETIGLGIEGGTNQPTNIPGKSTPNPAQAGEIYVFLLTNYDLDPGFIKFKQTSGTGRADCALVSGCTISDVTTTVGACTGSGVFSVSGSISFTKPPTTGTLTVTSTLGGTQTFNAPFTSPISYALSGLTANGASGTVTAVFSAENTCTKTSTSFTAPNKPSPPTVSPVNYCLGETASALSATGTALKWYDAATNGNLLSSAPIPTTTSPGPQSFWVSQTDGCESNRAELVVTVSSSMNINVSPVAVCNGTAATLTAFGATSYSWVIDGTSNVLSTSNPFITSNLNANTTFKVTGTTGACSGSNTVLVTVNNPPTTVASSNGPLCIGNTLNLSATNSTGATYNWTGPNGFSAANTQNPTLPNATAAASGIYTVTVASNGCSSTSDINVQINPGPPITPTSNGPICAGMDLILDVTQITNATYSWTGPAGFTSSIKNPTILAATILESGQYTITITANNCISTNSMNVTVSPSRIPTFLPISPLCQNDAAPVLSTSSLDSPPIIGVWSPSVIDATLVSPSTAYTFTPNAGQCSANYTMNVTVNPIPQLSITDPAPACKPSTVDLTSSKVISGNISSDVLTYWGNSSATISLKIPFMIAESGQYYIKNTSSSGCAIIKPVNVLINAKPKANFNPSPISVTTTNPTSTMLNLSVGASSYEWIFNDGYNSSVENPIHSFPDSIHSEQLVILIATSPAGCKDTTSKIIVVNEELLFYVPNSFTPDEDNFNQIFQPVFTSGYDVTSFSMYIYNRWGQLVFESHDAAVGWDGKLGKDGSKCLESVYTWKIDFKLKGVDKRQVFTGNINLLR